MDENGTTSHLKIAILLDRFMPSRGGERYFSLLARGLAGKGHDVHVFTTEAEESGHTPYKVHILPAIRRPRSLHILSFMSASVRALHGQDFDIVHGEALSTAINVYNPHGGAERAYQRQEFRSIIGRPVYRSLRYVKRCLSPRHYIETYVQAMLFKNAKVKKIIAVSDMVKRDIIRHHHVEADRIEVVFDGVDLELFHPDNKGRFRRDVRMSLGLDEQTPVILFASNNYRLKGLGILLPALAQLKERASVRPPCLIIAGRGKPGQYRRMIEKMGIANNVRFLGQVDGIERYYAASDLYAHPTFYDSCGLTILEALATGIPVVTTRFAGAAQMVQNGLSGFVLPDPSDALVLSRAIERCLQPGFATRAEAAARETVSGFSPDYNIHATLNVYRDVIAEERKSG